MISPWPTSDSSKVDNGKAATNDTDASSNEDRKVPIGVPTDSGPPTDHSILEEHPHPTGKTHGPKKEEADECSAFPECPTNGEATG